MSDSLSQFATYDALKALSDAASQGPWTHYCKAIPDAEEARAELASMVGTTEKAHGAVPSYDLHGVGYETEEFTLYTALTGCAPNSAANADFIVALVNAFRAGVPCVPSAIERSERECPTCGAYEGDHLYCKTCGSCGEDGCCPPEMCRNARRKEVIEECAEAVEGSLKERMPTDFYAAVIRKLKDRHE